MNKKIDDATKDRILDELLEKHAELDDMCHEIFFTLLAYEKLRFNQLLRTLKKLGIKITQPTLTLHLSHLIEKGIVEKEERFQETSYSLRSDINSVMHTSPEELKEWLENGCNNENLPKYLQPLKMTHEELFKKLHDEYIDKMTVNDLSDVLSLSLHELRNYINYDLQIGKFESDAAFWKFVGNPIYRMREKTITEHCRASEEYKKRLFEKIDLLINELRSDKEFFREREKKQKNRLRKYSTTSDISASEIKAASLRSAARPRRSQTVRKHLSCKKGCPKNFFNVGRRGSCSDSSQRGLVSPLCKA